mmetsp:Transcript_36235/g.41276  ORF Transcript_36235/g.41276 Transcript_36235/m.41276 type:complete len:202 (+) Transcript_36235:402-1007(+)
MTTFLVNFLNSFKIIFREVSCGCRISDEEGILSVSGRMLLRLEQSIEIPERVFYILVGGHFFETHFQQNIGHLSSHLQQGMQMSPLSFFALSIQIDRFEIFFGPVTLFQHFEGQISAGFHSFYAVVITLENSESFKCVLIDPLSLLQSINICFCDFFAFRDLPQEFLIGVLNGLDCFVNHTGSLIQSDPTLLHSLSKANFA